MKRFLSILCWLATFFVGTIAVLVATASPDMPAALRFNVTVYAVLVALVLLYLSILLGHETEVKQ